MNQDTAALMSLDAAVRAVCPIVGIALTNPALHTTVITFDPSATGPQQTAANNVVAAFDWSAAAQSTRIAQAEKAAATASIDNGQLISGARLERLIRAVAVAALHELNLHTTFEGALLAAIAAATSLADLKTRVAAITPVPQRADAQIVTAVKAEIAQTAE